MDGEPMNPFNQLPTDGDVVRRVEEMVRECAKETGHLCLMVVAKEDGKCIVAIEGVPEAQGWLGEVMKREPAQIVFMVARMMIASDAYDSTPTPS